MTIRVVLFDLDGTLVDSLPDLTDAVNQVRSTYSLPCLPSDDVRRMVGKGARNLISQVLPDGSPDDFEPALRIFIEFNRCHIADKSRPYPGIVELLAQLRKSGRLMAVISNKHEFLSRRILRQLNIDDYFECICGGDTYPEMKPSPLPLLRVIEQLGVTPAEAVMVGDSINDIEAAIRAGIPGIGCNWGYGTTQELSAATYVADSCADILKIIHTLET